MHINDECATSMTSDIPGSSHWHLSMASNAGYY